MRNSKFTLFVFGFALALLISCEHKKSDYEESVNGLQSPGFIYLWLLESGYLSGGCEGEGRRRAKFFPEMNKEYILEGNALSFQYYFLNLSSSKKISIQMEILTENCEVGTGSLEYMCNGLFNILFNSAVCVDLNNKKIENGRFFQTTGKVTCTVDTANKNATAYWSGYALSSSKSTSCKMSFLVQNI